MHGSSITHQASKLGQDSRAQIGKQSPDVQFLVSHRVRDYSETRRAFSGAHIGSFIILEGEASFGKRESRGFRRDVSQCVLELL